MDSVKVIKFKQISPCLRAVFSFLLMGLLLKVHPTFVSEISLSFLKPYIAEIMFFLAMLIFSLAIYAYNSASITITRYLLITALFAILARSSYIRGGYIFSVNALVLSFMTLFLLFIRIYKGFKFTNIFNYFEELSLFLSLLIPGIVIILSQMDLIDWFQCRGLVIESITMLSGAMLSLVLILINAQSENMSIKVLISVVISMMSGFISYRFFKSEFIAISLNYGLISIWTLIVVFLKEKDFKLNE